MEALEEEECEGDRRNQNEKVNMQTSLVPGRLRKYVPVARGIGCWIDLASRDCSDHCSDLQDVIIF